MTTEEVFLRQLARDSGLGQKGIERLMGSISIEVVRPNHSQTTQEDLPDERKACRFNVGLRLQEILRQSRLPKSASLEVLVKLLRSYANTCPVVVGWIGRGDFNPQKPPKEVTFSLLQHATRTSGRLRAQFVRGFPLIPERDPTQCSE